MSQLQCAGSVSSHTWPLGGPQGERWWAESDRWPSCCLRHTVCLECFLGVRESLHQFLDSAQMLKKGPQGVDLTYILLLAEAFWFL